MKKTKTKVILIVLFIIIVGSIITLYYINQTNSSPKPTHSYERTFRCEWCGKKTKISKRFKKGYKISGWECCSEKCWTHKMRGY